MEKQKMRTDLAKELFDEERVKLKRKEVLGHRDGISFTVEEAEWENRDSSSFSGRYISVSSPKRISKLSLKESLLLSEIIKDEMLYLSKGRRGRVLTIGLGNREMTVDSLGVRCAELTNPTRGSFPDPMRGLSVFIPGVEASTGISSLESVRAVLQEVKPDIVIAVDSLAARSVSHLGSTVQISDVGITPGSGLGLRRSAINKDSLGTRVISVGVPTVISADSLLSDALAGEADSETCYVGLIDSDAVVESSARIIATAIEEAFS